MYTNFRVSMTRDDNDPDSYKKELNAMLFPSTCKGRCLGYYLGWGIFMKIFAGKKV